MERSKFLKKGFLAAALAAAVVSAIVIIRKHQAAVSM